MMSLKKTMMAILTLGSSMALAGTMGAVCVPGSVTTPCTKPAWSFGAQALYLQPTFSNMNALTSLTTVTAPMVGSVGRTNTDWGSPNLNWGWGFQIEGAYDVGIGKDLTLNWYRVHHASTLTRAASTFTGDYPINTVTIVSDRETVDPQWDAANAEFGQLIDLNGFSMLRFYGGVQYARVKTNISDTFSDSSLVSNATLSYNGFGPRIGLDLSCGLDRVMNQLKGLNVYGKAATALLVGPQSFSTMTTALPVGGIVGVATSSGSQMGIVPELEAKLGLEYTYAMSQGDLGLDLGWMWNTYFNTQSVAYSYNIASASITEYTSPTQSNFGLQGLYFGLKWMGSV
ncbi:MAG: Lpg1974 family pore-forming outer membrane protein [Legionellaceae bacterium]|nr:Lpg1974 family pore-forming outer membrane protein [Legionellaceae bacterium]